MKITQWNGQKITQPGAYSGISLREYHENIQLFDGPSVSKSPLKFLLPAHGGSPKAFWGRWSYNPQRVEIKETSKALDFGKAVHCLLLGDEVFSDGFAVRPEKAPDGRAWNGNNLTCQAWMKANSSKTIVTLEQVETIRRIGNDAAEYPLIKMGLLNGQIERTLCCRDEETGIWLKARPDAVSAEGVYADLKTASKFEEDFLERQMFDAGYYLQAAMTRMVCRQLGLPFETFVLVYVLNDDVPDTTHVEISEHDIDRGERAIRWCLKAIRAGLDKGEWPGARPFNGGERHLQMKTWAKDRLDRFLELEEQAAA